MNSGVAVYCKRIHADNYQTVLVLSQLERTNTFEFKTDSSLAFVIQKGNLTSSAFQKKHTSLTLE